MIDRPIYQKKKQFVQTTHRKTCRTISEKMKRRQTAKAINLLN